MIPLIQKLIEMAPYKSQNRKPAPAAIIIEPTRELCMQVYEQGVKLADGGWITDRSLHTLDTSL
jgi:superfamily II DNA/RNA helicase